MTPTYFDNKGRLNDVVIIRSIAIVLVVAFHAYYMMMVPGHFPETTQMYHDMYFNVNCLILQFRMPLFIFISGYLFSHLENDRGKYATFRELLSNKFKRLIIPFFVFATVFMVSVNDFSLRPYYAWGYQHLWFIPMLFWCFIFTRIQSFAKHSRSSWWKIGLLSIFFVFNLIPRIQIPLLGLPNFLRWYFWFYLGYLWYLNRDSIYHIFNNHKSVVTIILATIFTACVTAKCMVLKNDNLHTWYTELGNIAIVGLLWLGINHLLISGLSGGGKNIREAKQIQLRNLCVSQLASTVYDQQHRNSPLWLRLVGHETSHLVSLSVHCEFVRPIIDGDVAPVEDQDGEISNRVKKKKHFRHDIAMMRFLCIVVVVFFHAYGMTYANHLPENTAIIYKGIYERLVARGPIIFAMPMFVFISGFLFGGQMMRKQPILFKVILKNKFMRLMVPFFVFTVIFMFTTNSVSWSPFYQWTYWHLWFLPMLFWCFVITYFLRPLIMSKNSWETAITLITVFALSFTGKFMSPFLGLHSVLHWLCWFVLGVWFYNHESMINSKRTKAIVAICGGLTYISLSLIYPQEYGDNTIVGELISICGIAALWCAVGLINFKDNRFTSLIVGLSGASFGIYIFHNWIELYMVSSTAQRLLPIDSFAMNHTILFPLLFSIIAFAISYGLSWSLLKTKIGKILIG